MTVRHRFKALVLCAGFLALSPEVMGQPDPEGIPVGDTCYVPAWRRNVPCSSIGQEDSPAPDYGAAQREQESARERQAEVERQERARIADEKRQKEAAFIRDRDATARTLRGTGGMAPNSGDLKGSVAANTGLKELRGSDRPAANATGPSGPQAAAWKQLHCAAEVAGYALAALQQQGDTSEFSFLSAQAMNALDGKSLSVTCSAAPAFPKGSGGAVNVDGGKNAQKKILISAITIAERMKQRGDKPSVSPPPVNETPEEKMRRVQRELNDANSRKIVGKTQQEIDQQERDRKELAKLILANSKLEKGELASFTFDTQEAAVAPKPRPKPVPGPQ